MTSVSGCTDLPCSTGGGPQQCSADAVAAQWQHDPSLQRILEKGNGCKQLSNITASEGRLETVSAQSVAAEEYYGKMKVGEMRKEGH